MATILLVDDDTALRGMLHEMLTLLGHDVVQVSDGAQALKAFRAKPTEVVIMDLIMPEMEGLETIRELKRSGAKTKILAISGGGRSDPRDLLVIAMQFGAHGVLAKPFSIAELTAALKALLPENA